MGTRNSVKSPVIKHRDDFFLIAMFLYVGGSVRGSVHSVSVINSFFFRSFDWKNYSPCPQPPHFSLPIKLLVQPRCVCIGCRPPDARYPVRQIATVCSHSSLERCGQTASGLERELNASADKSKGFCLLLLLGDWTNTWDSKDNSVAKVCSASEWKMPPE